jgi:hypothetical protein
LIPPAALTEDAQALLTWPTLANAAASIPEQLQIEPITIGAPLGVLDAAAGVLLAGVLLVGVLLAAGAGA